MTKNLDYLFYPKSVAVVGVSRKEKSIGREILKNLIEFGFDGRVYPINPSAYAINSIRCYPNLSAIPEETIDLAIIVVPSQYVKAVAEEAVENGVKSMVIITAGFREVGEKGRELEDSIHKICSDAGIRVIGPNCMGVFNGNQPFLNGTFAPLQPLGGNIGFISQSGALGVVVMEYATALNLGFSKFVSLGNKMDVNSNIMLEYYAKDEETKVILAYLESFSDPLNFSQVASKVSKNKPILMLKSGRTAAGARAATSHTGALAGQDSVISAAMESSGVIRVNSVDELFDSAMGFLKSPLPKGDKVAVLTNAGGPGTLLTDALISLGMRINTLSEETQKRLREVIPPEASPLNPVDLIASADAERYTKSLKILLEDDEVDSVIVIFVPPLMIQTINVANSIERILEEKPTEKPVLCCFMGRNFLMNSQLDFKYPIYEFPETAARVLRDMYIYSKWRATPSEEPVHLVPAKSKSAVKKLIKGALKKESDWVDQKTVQSILEHYGFSFPKSLIINSLEDLIDASGKIGFPLVVKLASNTISHKSDKGGVFLDLRTNDELIFAWRSIQKVYSKAGVPNEDRSVLVQKYFLSGVELALGSSFDDQFGHVLMLGSGGVLIELIKDVIFRLVPVNKSEAEKMIHQLRSFPLLLGYRGEPESDIEELILAISRLSQLVTDHPQISEIDMNPILALPKGQKPIVLDARMKLARM